jgi:hypothetical protein
MKELYSSSKTCSVEKCSIGAFIEHIFPNNKVINLPKKPRTQRRIDIQILIKDKCLISDVIRINTGRSNKDLLVLEKLVNSVLDVNNIHMLS